MKMMISPVDGREIDIEGMTPKQLRDLHYTVESQMAKLIQSYPAFSEERKRVTNEAYVFISSLLYNKADEKVSSGATNASVQLVCSIITKMKEGGGDSNRKIVVYEAGVGAGYAAKAIIKIPNVHFCGCDVNIKPSIKNIMQEHDNIKVNEDTLYNDLINMPDNSIDLFYADNVFEHLVPDEAPEILTLLYRKVKKGGMLVLFIPNRYTGPHDVSRYYLPQGHKATGFHFMELTYAEGISMGIRNGFWPRYIVKKDGSMFRLERDLLFFKNIIRILKEWLYSRVDNQPVRKELFSSDVFAVYVLEKK